MITPLLEKLIHEGKAQFRTWTTGLSGYNTIPIPSGNVCVITDIMVFPFAGTNPSEEYPRRLEIIYKNMFTLRLQSQKSSNWFNFRGAINNIWEEDRPDPTGNFAALYGNSEQLNTYLVHYDDIEVDWFQFSPFNNWAVSTDVVPPESNEENSPRGYQGVGVAQLFRPDGFTQYVPAANRANPNVLAGSQPLRYFQPKGNTLLQEPNPADTFRLDQAQFPLANFGGVLIFDKTTMQTQGSL